MTATDFYPEWYDPDYADSGIDRHRLSDRFFLLVIALTAALRI